MGLFSADKVTKFMVLDKPLRCQMCEHEEFTRKDVLLNTSFATFFGFDWANRSAMTFICERCGYIHWFVRK
jgi:predicted nucleic-acid-binding Zn-ribbon protein